MNLLTKSILSAGLLFTAVWSQNMLANGDFSVHPAPADSSDTYQRLLTGGGYKFKLVWEGQGAYTVAHTDSAVNINVTAPGGMDWHHSMSQDVQSNPALAPLESGLTYVFSFDAKADAGSEGITLAPSIGRTYGFDNYSPVALGNPVELTSEWQTFTVTSQEMRANEARYSVNLDFGLDSGSFWLDNFSLTALDPGEGPFSLTLIKDGSGTLTASPQQNAYNIGDVIEITAEPAAGWVFAEWTNGLSGNAASGTVTVQRNTYVTARFLRPGIQMLQNGDFALSPLTTEASDGVAYKIGGSGWQFTKVWDSQGDFTASWLGGVVRISVDSVPNLAWKHALTQSNETNANLPKLVKGQKYRFSFDAKAEPGSGGMMINPSIGRTYGYDSYTPVADRGPVTLTEEWQTFTVETSVMTADEDRYSVGMNFGTSAGAFQLDNFSLVLISDDIQGIESSHQAGARTAQLKVAGNSLYFRLAQPSTAALKIYNLSGKLVSDLTGAARALPAGDNRLEFGKEMSTGIYLIRLFDGQAHGTFPWTAVR